MHTPVDDIGKAAAFNAANTLAERLAVVGVLDGLSNDRAEAVVALAGLYRTLLQAEQLRAANDQELADTERRHLKRLTTALRRFKKSFKELQRAFDATTACSDVLTTFDPNLGSFLGSFEAVLTAVSDLHEPHDYFWECENALNPSEQFRERTVNEATVALMEFLVNSCGLGKGAASVRVARIDTVGWGGSIAEKDDLTLNRSSAILKRYARASRRLRPGQTRQGKRVGTFAP
jgi:hypothetical protein